MEVTKPRHDATAIAQQYLEQTERFRGARARTGPGRISSRFYWYHTIDLGDGLVTPGLYDYRGRLSAIFTFPKTCGA